MNKEIRQKKAQETLKLLREEFYLSEAGECVGIEHELAGCREGISLHGMDPPGKNGYRHVHGLHIEVAQETVLKGVCKLFEVGAQQLCFVNDAKLMDPMGGFLRGDDTDEAEILRATSLSLSYQGAPHFFGDGVDAFGLRNLYTKKVLVFRDTTDEYLISPAWETSAITTIALDATQLQGEGKHLLNGWAEAVRERLIAILNTAMFHSHREVAIGPIGCAPLAGDPEVVAEVYRDVLSQPTFGGAFDHIRISISPRFEDRVFWAFDRAFPQM